MTMNARTAVPNAIIFLLDPSNRSASIPVYVPGETIASNSTCISVATRAEVDGEVIFRLGQPLSDSDKVGCEQVFDGSIETPGRKLALVTARLEKVLEAEVPGYVTHVVVGVDDADSPCLVCVSVR